MKPKVVVIVGPTASGKTALSIELAKKLDGEIISSDSMQIYKDMDIGTAKVTKEEAQNLSQKKLKHLLKGVIMKLKILGSGGGEGFPATFCRCDNCEKARKLGGKNIRTCSQTLINDELLIDLPMDTIIHSLNNNICFGDFKNVLITGRTILSEIKLTSTTDRSRGSPRSSGVT